MDWDARLMIAFITILYILRLIKEYKTKAFDNQGQFHLVFFVNSCLALIVLLLFIIPKKPIPSPPNIIEWFVNFMGTLTMWIVCAICVVGSVLYEFDKKYGLLTRKIRFNNQNKKMSKN